MSAEHTVRLIDSLMRAERLYPFFVPPPENARGWVERDDGVWYAWASQHCFGAAFVPGEPALSEVPERLRQKIENERFCNALDEAIDATAEPCDAEALRAWVVSLIDFADEHDERVDLAWMQFDPRLLYSAVPLVVLGAEIRLGKVVLNGVDAVVIRGNGWLWCGAALTPRGVTCARTFMGARHA